MKNIFILWIFTTGITSLIKIWTSSSVNWCYLAHISVTAGRWNCMPHVVTRKNLQEKKACWFKLRFSQLWQIGAAADELLAQQHSPWAESPPGQPGLGATGRIFASHLSRDLLTLQYLVFKGSWGHKSPYAGLKPPVSRLLMLLTAILRAAGRNLLSFLFYLNMASPSPELEILANPVFLLIAPYAEDHCSFQSVFMAVAKSGLWSFLFWMLHREVKTACCHEKLPREAEGGGTSAFLTRSSWSGRSQSCNELHYCCLLPAAHSHMPVAGVSSSQAAPLHVLQQGQVPSLLPPHRSHYVRWHHSCHPCHLSRHGIWSWTQAAKGSRGHFSCLARGGGTPGVLYSAARGNFSALSPARLKPLPCVEFCLAKLCYLPRTFWHFDWI